MVTRPRHEIDLAASTINCVSSLRIPIGVRRPAGAREALRRSPLMEASRADSPSVKRVPLMPTIARPKVVLAGRPSAQRASDVRFRWIVTIIFLRLAIQNHGRLGNVIHGP